MFSRNLQRYLQASWNIPVLPAELASAYGQTATLATTDVQAAGGSLELQANLWAGDAAVGSGVDSALRAHEGLLTERSTAC